MQAVQHLQVAIAAIERGEAETQKRIEQYGQPSKRGYLTKVVIEALREGIGAVSLIVRYAEEQGIKTTGPSVSNAIQRLQEKKIVQYDLKKQIWTLTEAARQVTSKYSLTFIGLTGIGSSNGCVRTRLRLCGLE